MEPNAILREEHEAIEHLLAAVEGMGTRLRREPLPKADLDAAMAAITEFADQCHHAKEEKVLFPALAQASPKVGAELARRLTSDHRAFRKLVGDTRALLPRTDTASRQQLSKNLLTYARLLREHIRIEEEQLLPEVERSLDAGARERIAMEFDRVEEAEVGPGVHERHHEAIHRLAHTYGHG